ncbi:MAG: large-conductance mechanosensitive channel protein MscL [Candidatus Nomurabacteria bacterium]|jgi:large conductance mechanosensitive channel|nr:large-conductance mechanosensitive channel protein MscL [Candidatus Nomurabacteria bacterium]
MDKKELEKATRGIRKFQDDFKKFVAKGNVVDLAVGVIIGGAFGKIVSSLVDDILMPGVGLMMGGFDFSELSIRLGSANIKYGSFLQNVVDFLIIALSIFVFVRFINKLQSAAAKPKMEVEDKPAASKADEQLAVLKEIRDNLNKS